MYAYEMFYEGSTNFAGLTDKLLHQKIDNNLFKTRPYHFMMDNPQDRWNIFSKKTYDSGWRNSTVDTTKNYWDLSDYIKHEYVETRVAETLSAVYPRIVDPLIHTQISQEENDIFTNIRMKFPSDDNVASSRARMQIRTHPSTQVLSCLEFIRTHGHRFTDFDIQKDSDKDIQQKIFFDLFQAPRFYEEVQKNPRFLTELADFIHKSIAAECLGKKLTVQSLFYLQLRSQVLQYLSTSSDKLAGEAMKQLLTQDLPLRKLLEDTLAAKNTANNRTKLSALSQALIISASITIKQKTQQKEAINDET